MTLTLHLAKGTVAVAPHILLEELGVPFDLVWIDFRENEQHSADYAAINPKGRVPVLTTPHGRLTETAAILNFLAASHPDAGFWPDDPWLRARSDEMAVYLASTVHVNHAHKGRGNRWSDDPAALESMRAKVTENLTANCALIEAGLSSGLWVLGDRFSIADIYLFAVSRWLQGDGVKIADFPRLAAHFDAMQARPAVQRALALHS